MKWIAFELLSAGTQDKIRILEIAAQAFSDFQPTGGQFHVLVNHEIDISPIATRMHGYDKHDFERKGLLPEEAYQRFIDFCGESPLVSMNLRSSVDRLLLPSFEDSGIRITERINEGFSIMELASRILDPLPTINAKLVTLCSYFKIKTAELTNAKEEIQSIVSLLSEVIFPLVEKKSLNNFSDLRNELKKKWFPTKLTFGKYKGHYFTEAKQDDSFKSWLEYTAGRKNSFSEAASWYLERLESENFKHTVIEHVQNESDETRQTVSAVGSGLILWEDPEIIKLQALVHSARERLAEIEAELSLEKSRVDKIRREIFLNLRKLYERKEILLLRIDYREKYLKSLLQGSDYLDDFDEEKLNQQEKEKKQEFDQEQKNLDSIKQLTREEKERLKHSYRELAKRFHPDKNLDDPKVEKLFAIISEAKKRNNLSLLEKILDDPDSFSLLNEDDIAMVSGVKATQVSKVLDILNESILSNLEELNSLRSSQHYEMALKSEKDKTFLIDIIETHRKALAKEINNLESEARDLEIKIEQQKTSRES